MVVEWACEQVNLGLVQAGLLFYTAQRAWHAMPSCGTCLEANCQVCDLWVVARQQRAVAHARKDQLSRHFRQVARAAGKVAPVWPRCSGSAVAHASQCESN